MTTNKQSIRPTLNLAAEGVEENFQNVVLRPILKLQHEILLLVLANYLKKQKLDIHNTSNEKLANSIDGIVSKNNAFKNQLLGIVIGQFTSDEFKKYEIQSSEFNKRIFGMTKKRYTDSLEEIRELFVD